MSDMLNTFLEYKYTCPKCGEVKKGIEAIVVIFTDPPFASCRCMKCKIGWEQHYLKKGELGIYAVSDVDPDALPNLTPTYRQEE